MLNQSQFQSPDDSRYTSAQFYRSPQSNQQQIPPYDYQNQQFAASQATGFNKSIGGFPGARDTFATSLQSSNAQPLRFSQSQNKLQNNFNSSQGLPFSGTGGEQRQSLAPNQRSQVVPVQREERYQDDVRDRIIAMYKDEIKIQGARERDFKTLQDAISDLQRRLRQLDAELQDNQRDHEDRQTGQNKQINHLQGDIENLKKNIHERQQEGIKVYDDIQNVKRAVEDKVSEIYSTNRELESVKGANDQLRREIEFVQQDIYQTQDLRKRQQQAIYQSKNDLRYKEKEVDELKVKQQLLEKEQKTLSERTRVLNEQVDGKALQVEKVTIKLDQTDREINNLKSQITVLDVEINDVDRSNARAVEAQKKLIRQKDQELLRGQEQDGAQRGNDQRVKELDYNIEQFKRDLEGVRYSNDALLDRNHDLKQELESLNSHSELLISQNRELQRELDSFIETDEVVRQNLDRKDKVYQIRNQVDEVIKKSMFELAQRSPTRAKSPVVYEERHLTDKKQQQSQYQGYGAANQELNVSRVRQSNYGVPAGESFNNRGSPLRRGHLDHQY